MAKKRFTYDEGFDEDEELLMDRKAKRKRERELERQRRDAESQPKQPVDDTMGRVVALCQENRWREAKLLCLGAIQRYQEEGKPENAAGVEVALQKIDRSLRRQMVAAFVFKTEKELLGKEPVVE